jgi:hypothetical protein
MKNMTLLYGNITLQGGFQCNHCTVLLLTWARSIRSWCLLVQEVETLECWAVELEERSGIPLWTAWCWQGRTGPNNPGCDNECNRAASDYLAFVETETLNNVTRSPAGRAAQLQVAPGAEPENSLVNLVSS